MFQKVFEYAGPHKKGLYAATAICLLYTSNPNQARHHLFGLANVLPVGYECTGNRQ